MAATDIVNDSNFSESSFIEDFDRTSESSSVLQSSPEPQQAGSPGTVQNLSNAVNEQMKVSSPRSRKDFDRTSESSSVLQRSPESQQAGSPGTDQNLSNAVNEQTKVSSPPSRKRGTSSATQENDNRMKACLQ